MPQATVIARVLPVCSFVLTLSACSITPAQTLFTVSFKVLDGYMVVVPVSINGGKPLDFLLDTGTSRTMIDSKLADGLELPTVTSGEIVGIQGAACVSLAHSDSISVGGAKVNDLNLTVAPGNTGLPHELHGIIGEDFLERFDVLIDNRHHRIELEPGSGYLAATLNGERLPVRLNGIADGQPTSGRLIIASHAPELSNDEVMLLLDSGINSFVLLRGTQSLGAGAIEQIYTMVNSANASNLVRVSTRNVSQLRLGSRILGNVNAIAPPARPGADTDGLLPTSLFHSIFISHSQKYIILDPARRR